MNIGGKIIIDDETLVYSLSDSDLEKLSTAIYIEQGKRISVQIKTNKFEKPTQGEMDICNSKMTGEGKITAIKAYRERNGCSLLLAKMVFDSLT